MVVPCAYDDGFIDYVFIEEISWKDFGSLGPSANRTLIGLFRPCIATGFVNGAVSLDGEETPLADLAFGVTS